MQIRPIAWSHSALNSFENCPRRYHLLKERKVVEKQSEQMLWGNQVHKALELRVSEKKVLPDYLMKYDSLIRKFETTPGRLYAEQKMAINADFAATTWMAKDVWCRAILDLHLDQGGKCIVVDWKTGKPKPDSDQLKLTAAMIFHQKPAVTKVKTSFVWLAHNKVDNETFTRDQLPQIWSEFMPRVERMAQAFAENKWPAKPSGLCRNYCPVPKSMCEFSGV